MKNITILFLAAELLDLITTLIGIRIPGVVELHPAGLSDRVFIYKIFASVVVALVLQFRDLPKAAWLIPGIAGMPAAWNILVIAAEVLNRGV